MTELIVAHTADLDATSLAATRRLLEGVFAGSLTDADWDHALGGVHALLWDGPDLVGHGSVVQRRMLHRERSIRTGYVEGVGVRADRRRRGHAGTLMAALERIAREAYELAALSASDDGVGLYVSRGWVPWRGPTSVLAPSGVLQTPADDGAIYVLEPADALDLDGELTCDWRDGDVW